MIENLKELWQYRQLILMFVERDLRARYKQTVIGFLWAIIQPLFMMLIFTIVFSKFLSVSSGGVPYPVFSYSVLVPWLFFQRSITSASESLIAHSNIVTKIYFPREIIPLASTFSTLIDFFIAFLLFLIMMFIFKIPLSVYILLFPFIFLIQTLFAASLSLFFSSLSIVVRDLRYALPLLIQVWMYGSPVIYGVQGLQKFYQNLLFLNPITGILESYRSIFLYQQLPRMDYLTLSFLFTIIFSILSYRWFKTVESTFIDFL